MVNRTSQQPKCFITPEKASFGLSLFLPLVLALTVIILHAGSLHPHTLTITQTNLFWHWFFFQEPLAYLVCFSVILALPGCWKSALGLLISAGIMTLIFWGGWQIPACPISALHQNLGTLLTFLLQLLVFIFKLALVVGSILWVRWSLPQSKPSQWVRLSWTLLLPLLICNLLITALRFLFIS